MIGILCGLKSEAKIADKVPGVLVGCSAVQETRARELVSHMIDQGVTRLISFGLAAACSPDLAAGDLVLGSTLLSTRGAWEADSAWNMAMLRRAPEFMCGAVWGSKRLVSLPQEKEAIYIKTGAMILDMESHIVAEAAANEGIPFNIVRAITDTAEMRLPPAARVPVNDNGGVDYKNVFSSIVNQPSQLIELMNLGKNTSLALRALKDATSIMREIEDDVLLYSRES